LAVITIITEIRAPVERVFDLSRSVDLHMRSAGATGETATDGITSGLLELGQEVTLRGKHFGIWQNLTSRITMFSRPRHFRDSMVRGAFRRLDHDHFFEAQGDLTIMKDVFDFTSPFGILGRLADALFLESYMRRFIVERNNVIKKSAEGDDWKLYLQSSLDLGANPSVVHASERSGHRGSSSNPPAPRLKPGGQRDP
jgi:ligand-binding SRPBCC domain-containing protein